MKKFMRAEGLEPVSHVEKLEIQNTLGGFRNEVGS